MKNYYISQNEDPFQNIPLTFHIKEGLEDQEYQAFVENYNVQKNKKGCKNIWIIKPGEITNRGYGISVSDNLATINQILQQKKGNRTYIIQKYLERPLLFKNRKFDLRCYILVTCYNKQIKGYWYNEGYVRTSSKEYNLKNLDNKFIHLTNDCVQRKAEDYGKFETGNKVSFSDFQKYVETVYKISFYEIIYPKIKKIATDCIRAVFNKITTNRKNFCFELFGLDFMIDDHYKAWLIEANVNPDLDSSSPTLARLIPNLIDNVLKIAIDPLFPPPNFPKSKKAYIQEQIYESNRFELVFDEKYDSAKFLQINQEEDMNCLIFDEEIDYKEKDYEINDIVN